MNMFTTAEAIARLYADLEFAHGFLGVVLETVKHLFGNDQLQTVPAAIVVDADGDIRAIQLLVDIPEAVTAEEFHADYIGGRVAFDRAEPQYGDLRVVGRVGGLCCLQIRVLADGMLHVVIEPAAVINVGNN
jgi:hypothetical protein